MGLSPWNKDARQREGGQWGYKLLWGSLLLTLDLTPHGRGDLMEVVVQQVIAVS